MILDNYIHLESFEKAFDKKNAYSQVAVLVDENTLKYCYPLIVTHLPKHSLIEITSGEKHKNIETCQKIWSHLMDKHFDRKSLLINLGGGVIGDMGGFCAATYKRGIDFIQIPTTLLAQVDASIGGKLGIDFHGFKNHIGLFCRPKQVIIDTDFLNTLPLNELRSGFAEVIKHCLIADEKAWGELITNELEENNWQKIVFHSVNIKSNIVTSDPKEMGLRKTLNYGHTVGHALETYYLEKYPDHALLHGEAVAVGIVAECFMAFKRGLLSENELKNIEAFIFKIFPKVNILTSDITPIIALTLHDKKNENGKVKGILLEKVGKPIFDVDFGLEEMEKSLFYYKNIEN